MHLEIDHNVVPFTTPDTITTEGRTLDTPEGTAMPPGCAPYVRPMEVPVSVLSDDELAAMCEDWRKAVYEKAGRAMPTPDPQRVKVELMLVDAYLEGKHDKKKAGSTALIKAAASFARATMKSHMFK